ncbi:MAG TPA: T9SS type A sorting domain-containing protein [Melioribacteraceae bacterium]|nr:T9SS type A sorting domain-containing protein [Melioribacteraceae bacterium]
MKKAYTLFCLFTLYLTTANSQISISASDVSLVLALGRSYTTYWDENTQTIDIGTTGASSWDFSNLVSTHTFVTTSKTVGSSAYVSDFSGAGFASNSENTYMGTTSNTWVYNSVTSSYLLNGTGTNVASAGTTTKIKYNPAQVLYNLPLTFNSTNSQQTQQEVISVVKTQFGEFTTTLTNTVNRSYIVDAYGQMKLPGGKLLSCLRLKETTSITTQQGSTTTTVNYQFLTRTGETVTVSVKENQSNTGVVQIEQVTWSSGDGTSENPTSIQSSGTIPSEFALLQNYPNPFNPTTKISFSIPSSQFISLKVYDVTGREILSLINQELNAGLYSLDFNGSGLSSGIYFYRLNAGPLSQSRKMILIK